jgi:hypothetical protein
VKVSYGLALGLTVGGCAPFVAPSGYEGTQYACDRPELWDALVASCDPAAGCPGVASLEGETQGEPFVVASALEGASVGEPELDLIEVSGRSPYFEYVLSARSVGQPQILDLVSDAELRPDHLLDQLATLELQMIVPHRTLIREAAPGVGALEVSAQESAFELSFEGSFQGESIRGCVLARPPEQGVP